MSHLQEAEMLTRDAIEQAIDLLPDGDNMPTAAGACTKGVALLQTLRAIQNEMKLAVSTLVDRGWKDGAP